MKKSLTKRPRSRPVAAGEGPALVESSSAVDGRREQLIAVAARLFNEFGYASTSINDVAKAAGILKGNICYYFKTKDDLLRAVTQARSAALAHALTHDLSAEATPAATIMRLLDHVEAQAQDLARLGCPMGTLSGELGKCATDTQGDARHASAANLLIELLDGLMRQFRRILPAKEARECAEQLLSMLQGAAVLAQATRDPTVVMRRVAAARRWLAQICPVAEGQ